MPNAMTLLQDAPMPEPRSMADLPAWFATLSTSELHAVWVAAVIEAAMAGASVRDLSEALAAVRDHTGATPDAMGTRSRDRAEDVVAKLLEQMPQVGDRVKLRDLWHLSSVAGSYVRNHLRDARFQVSGGRRGPYGTCWVERIAP